MFEVLHYIF